MVVCHLTLFYIASWTRGWESVLVSPNVCGCLRSFFYIFIFYIYKINFILYFHSIFLYQEIVTYFLFYCNISLFYFEIAFVFWYFYIIKLTRLSQYNTIQYNDLFS